MCQKQLFTFLDIMIDDLGLLKAQFSKDPTKMTHKSAGADCKKSILCSDDLSEVDETSCLSVEFGDGQVFQKHNLYDVSMKKALKPGENLVIETVLSPGTVHFHRLCEVTICSKFEFSIYVSLLP